MGKVMENLWKKRYIDAMESFKFMKDHLMKRKIAYARLKKYPERDIYEAKFKDIPFDRAILLKKEWHDTLAQEGKRTVYEKRMYQKGLEELLALTDEAMKETVFSITEHSAHRMYHENNSILKKDEVEKAVRYEMTMRVDPEKAMKARVDEEIITINLQTSFIRTLCNDSILMEKEGLQTLM